MMAVLSDSRIQELVDTGVISNVKEDSKIGPVSLDLTTEHFVVDGEYRDSVSLEPGESVFVQASEKVQLPSNLACDIRIRNSRLRQGLHVDAPLYVPGHKTALYFRVSNVSNCTVSLTRKDVIAQAIFLPVDGQVTHEYSGSFQNETEWRGMASYKGIFEKELGEIRSGANEVHEAEHRIYANVIAGMAIFAAIFTLVNINVARAGQSWLSLLDVNLVTVASFSVLVGLLAIILPSGKKSRGRGAWRIWVPFVIAIVLLAICLLVH